MDETTYISLAEIQARPLPPGFETISGPLPYTLLNDLLFRIVFEANQDALKALLCSLLHLKESDISELVITNPIRLGETPNDKIYIYDIYLLLNNRKKIHLELQVLRQDFWVDRSLCYLCRDFGDLNTGETYEKIKPLIQIDIIDFDLYENSREFYSTYHLANDKTGRIYSDKLTLHVLDLRKEEYATEEDKTYRIDHWARLFKSTTWEEIRMLAQEQKVLQSTIETMYRISADDYVRAQLAAREDELRQQLSTQLAHKEQLDALNKTIHTQQATIHEQEQQLAEQGQQLATFIDRQRRQIEKKIMAGKSLEQIAAELEEEPENIRELYETILAEGKV